MLVAVGHEEPPVAGSRLRVADSVYAARGYMPAALFVEEVTQSDATDLVSLWSPRPADPGDVVAEPFPGRGGCAVLTVDNAPLALARLAGYVWEELHVVVRPGSFLDVVVSMSPGMSARISELDRETGRLCPVSALFERDDYDPLPRF